MTDAEDMESSEPRAAATPPTLDGGDVVFDMVPLDGPASVDDDLLTSISMPRLDDALAPSTPVPPPPAPRSDVAQPPTRSEATSFLDRDPQAAPSPAASDAPSSISDPAPDAIPTSIPTPAPMSELDPLPPLPTLDITSVLSKPSTDTPPPDVRLHPERPAVAAAIAATTDHEADAELIKRERLAADVGLSLPDPSRALRQNPEEVRRDIERTRSTSDTVSRLPMLPARIVAALGTSAALVLFGWQVTRVIDDQDRLPALGWGAAVAAVLAAIAVVLWTWTVTENARRVLDPARTQEPPNPSQAALTWTVPFVFIAAVSVTVTYLSAELNNPSADTRSALPLTMALAAIVLVLPMMYSPVIYLSTVVRKIGGHGIRFAEWIWVPVALGAVGAAVIAGLRVGGAFGEDFEGLAPTWAVGVAAIVPAVMVVSLGWRAAATVESDVVRAFDRRLGVASGVTRRASKLSAVFAESGPNHAALRSRGFISQLPGAHAGSLVVATCVAGLTLLSLVGSVVMFLFWREGRNGVLRVSQIDNAWNVLEQLQNIERAVLILTVGVATIWSFVAVTNVRLASARRRNPVLVAATWPVAAAGVWIIGGRQVADGGVGDVLLGFAGQAALLAVPLLALHRAAGSVGSRRHTFRIAWALGVVLLVHIQGLGGLSNVATTTDSTEIARLSGYLAISALLEFFLTLALAGAMRSLSSTTAAVANRHNGLVLQRQQTDVVAKTSAVPAPRMGDPSISGMPQQ